MNARVFKKHIFIGKNYGTVFAYICLSLLLSSLGKRKRKLMEIVTTIIGVIIVIGVLKFLKGLNHKKEGNNSNSHIINNYKYKLTDAD